MQTCPSTCWAHNFKYNASVAGGVDTVLYAIVAPMISRHPNEKLDVTPSQHKACPAASTCLTQQPKHRYRHYLALNTHVKPSLKTNRQTYKHTAPMGLLCSCQNTSSRMGTDVLAVSHLVVWVTCQGDSFQHAQAAYQQRVVWRQPEAVAIHGAAQIC